jgi:transposase-like protein
MEYNQIIEVLNDKTNRNYTAEFKQEAVVGVTH